MMGANGTVEQVAAVPAGWTIEDRWSDENGTGADVIVGDRNARFLVILLPFVDAVNVTVMFASRELKRVHGGFAAHEFELEVVEALVRAGVVTQDGETFALRITEAGEAWVRG